MELGQRPFGGSGFSHFDEARAWTEIDTLFSHQWNDGMVPHIIFHEEDDGYFPGPNVWGTGRPVPTSGITQPPVAGFAVKRIFDRATDPGLAEARALDLLPRIHAGTNGSSAVVIPRVRDWSRSFIHGSLAVTIRSIGTCRLRRSRPTVSNRFSGAIPNMPTRPTGQRTSSTSAISGWCRSSVR